MSSSRINPTLVSTSTVSQFLAHERIATRQWLHCQMDSLLDQLLDQLNEKFVNFVAASGDPNETDHHHHHESIDTVNNHSSTQKVNNPSFQIKQEIYDLDQINESSTQSNSQSNLQSNSQSNLQSNSKSNLEFNLKNPQLTNREQNNEDDDQDDNSMDCDDDDLLIDLSDSDSDNNNQEPNPDENDDDGAEFVRAAGEGTLRTRRKRKRTGQVKHKVKNPDKNIIILSLQCQEAECEEEFPDREKLDDHLKLVHRIEKYRCMVRQCNVSYDNKLTLGTHINTVHGRTTKWRCSRCPKHFSTYPVLYDHYYKYHQFGHFQCSHPECGFQGDSKVKMYLHQLVHNSYRCTFPGCEHKARDSNRLKTHERRHAGIKPYRCKWPNCAYSSVARNGAMQHIMKVHLKIRRYRKANQDCGSEKKKGEDQQRDPRDFLEVNNELL